MSARGNRRRVAALSCAVALLAVTGCQSSDEPSDAPSSAAGTASSSPPAVVPTSSTTAVEPADGRLIKVPGASMHGLSTYKRYADYGIVQGYADKRSAISLSPSLTTAPSLDAFAKEYVRENGGAKVMRRLDDVVVGGKYSAWQIVDLSEKPDDMHFFGVMFLDSAWLIRITRFDASDDTPLTDDEFQQVVDSLLASFRTDLD